MNKKRFKFYSDDYLLWKKVKDEHIEWKAL